MANIKVSELPSASTLYDGDALMIVQNNESKKLNGEYFNDKFNRLTDVLLRSGGGITGGTIKSVNGYGNILVVSAIFTCVIQLGLNNVEIKDIYGTHGDMNVSVGNNFEFTITGLYNWDHYIFIGSSAISEITLN